MDLETTAPIEALSSSDIHVRCAGCRDLAKVGVPEQIPHLVKRAREDKSPAVRLCAAGATADILSRHRAEGGQDTLSDDKRDKLLDLFKGIDPANNAGLFPMLAGLDLPQSFSRIATGLRDPRGDVRVGAAVGLLRLAISQSRLGAPELEEQIVGLLNDSRLKPDALAEVARVCAAAGYLSALPRLQSLDIGAESAHAEIITEVVERMDEMSVPPEGAWFSDGLDAGEVNPEPPKPAAILVVLESGIAATFEVGDATWRRNRDFPGEDFRRMHFRRVGASEPGHAMQTLGRTWYRATSSDLSDILDEALQLDSLEWGPQEGAGVRSRGVAAKVSEVVVPTLDEKSSSDQRFAALIYQQAGLNEPALKALEATIQLKKIPYDIWLFLGDARMAAGDEEGAREAWELAIKKARRKRDWYVPVARERLGEDDRK